MKKTVTININGRKFFIDDDAYTRLRAYLDKIEQSFKSQESGEEIIGDIESRISEIFEERINRETGVVTLAMVEDVIAIMGEPEEINEEEPKAKSTSQSMAYVKASKRFYRDIDNRVLGGVCAGIAAYLGIDSVIVRLIAILLIPLTSGAMILIYLVLWMALPPALTTAQKLEMRGKHITINTIEQSIKDEYEEVKKNLGNFRESKAYKSGQSFFSRFSKSDKTVLIVIAGILSMFALWQFGHVGMDVFHAPMAVFTGFTHSVAPTFNHVFFPGALTIVLVLLVVGLVFKTLFKIILYIIAFLLLGALTLKVLFWMFGGFLLMC